MVAWQHSGCSVIGPGHIRKKLPNQDCYRGEHGAWGEMIAVCDGMGSCPLSHIGSHSASQAVYETASLWQDKLYDYFLSELGCVDKVTMAGDNVGDRGLVTQDKADIAVDKADTAVESTVTNPDFHEGMSSPEIAGSSTTDCRSEQVQHLQDQHHNSWSNQPHESEVLDSSSHKSSPQLRKEDLGCSSESVQMADKTGSSSLEDNGKLLHYAPNKSGVASIMSELSAKVARTSSVIAEVLHLKRPTKPAAEHTATKSGSKKSAVVIYRGRRKQVIKQESHTVIAASKRTDTGNAIHPDVATPKHISTGTDIYADTGVANHPYTGTSAHTPVQTNTHTNTTTNPNPNPATSKCEHKECTKQFSQDVCAVSPPQQLMQATQESNSLTTNKAQSTQSRGLNEALQLHNKVEGTGKGTAKDTVKDSAKYTGKGSGTKTSSAELQVEVRGLSPLIDWRSLSSDFLQQLYFRWYELIAPHEAKDCNTTCLFAVHWPKLHIVLVGQLGDGMVAINSHNQTQVLFEADNKAFANFTYGLGNVLNFNLWRLMWIHEEQLNAVMLTTDGVADDLQHELRPLFVSDILQGSLSQSYAEFYKDLEQMLINWPTPMHSDDKTIACLIDRIALAKAVNQANL